MSVKTLMQYLAKQAAALPDTLDTRDTPSMAATPATPELAAPAQAPTRPPQPSPPLALPNMAKLANPRPATAMQSRASWQPLSAAYHQHHANCPVCIAAGQGYGLRCGVGAALWVAYIDAT